MRKLLSIVVLALGLATQQAGAVQYSVYWANDPNTSISFGGGAFTFTDTLVAGVLHQFDISGVSGGLPGDSIGAKGRLNPGGPWTIGAITTAGPIQTAPVTGSATLELFDVTSPLAGPKLTGTINWIDITTLGVGGTLNLNGVFNVSGISYPGTGTVVDYQQLAQASGGLGSAVVTFQFIPARTLTQLKAAPASNPLRTSYSGTLAVDVNVPDAGTTVTLLSLGVLSLAAYGRKRTL